MTRPRGNERDERGTVGIVGDQQDLIDGIERHLVGPGVAVRNDDGVDDLPLEQVDHFHRALSAIGRVDSVPRPDLTVVHGQQSVGTGGVVAAVETREASHAEEELPAHHGKHVDAGIRAIRQDVDAQRLVDEADVVPQQGGAGYGDRLSGERHRLIRRHRAGGEQEARERCDHQRPVSSVRKARGFAQCKHDALPFDEMGSARRRRSGRGRYRARKDASSIKVRGMESDLSLPVSVPFDTELGPVRL